MGRLGSNSSLHCQGEVCQRAGCDVTSEPGLSSRCGESPPGLSCGCRQSPSCASLDRGHGTCTSGGNRTGDVAIVLLLVIGSQQSLGSEQLRGCGQCSCKVELGEGICSRSFRPGISKTWRQRAAATFRFREQV